MKIISYSKKEHKKIIAQVVALLDAGKVVAYPTDTSYGLACDIENTKALNKLYAVKERGFNKPIHVIPPSLAYAKKIAKWNPIAKKLARAFWPGPLTLVLPLAVKHKNLYKMSAGTGNMGLRIPASLIALDLAKKLGRPISTTSANPLGTDDRYSGTEVAEIFKNKKNKPDIILDAGKLPRRKPSTFVKVNGESLEFLRIGPISKKQIKTALNDTKV